MDQEIARAQNTEVRLYKPKKKTGLLTDIKSRELIIHTSEFVFSSVRLSSRQNNTD